MEPLFPCSVVSGVFFLFFVLFSIVCLLNIVTGVLLNTTLELAQVDRELMVWKEMRHQEDVMKNLTGLFKAADEDGDGKLSRKEFQDILNDDWAKSFFVTLGLDMQDTDQLFDVVAPDKEDEIYIEDFVQGAMRLKGQARSVDVYALLLESARIAKTIDGLIQFVEEHFDKLDDYFHPDDLPHQRIKHVMPRVAEFSSKKVIPRLRSTNYSSHPSHSGTPMLFSAGMYMSPRVSTGGFSNSGMW